MQKDRNGHHCWDVVGIIPFLFFLLLILLSFCFSSLWFFLVFCIFSVETKPARRHGFRDASKLMMHGKNDMLRLGWTWVCLNVDVDVDADADASASQKSCMRDDDDDDYDDDVCMHTCMHVCVYVGCEKCRQKC